MINTTYVEAEDKLYNIPTYDFSIYRYKKKSIAYLFCARVTREHSVHA